MRYVLAVSFLAACGPPMDLTIDNQTDSELLLVDPTVFSDVVPELITIEAGEVIDLRMSNAPALQTEWYKEVHFAGPYVNTWFGMDMVRDADNELVVTEADENAFLLLATNETGQSFTALHVGIWDTSAGSDPMPGTNYGPLAAGSTAEISLVAGLTYNYGFLYADGTGRISYADNLSAARGEDLEYSIVP